MTKLFIIGNGFDIHHGIRSRYTDFAEWLKGVDPGVFNAVEEFIPTCIDARGNQLNAWSDLENNLANFDTDQLIDYGGNFLPSYGADDWSDAGHHDHEYELNRVISKVSVELHKRFVEWLRTLAIPGATLFPVSAVDPRGKFLNFNYTPTLQRIYGATDVLHIHGSLLDDASEIVLGHGWEPESRELLASHINEDTDTRVAGGYHLIDDYFSETFKPTEKIIERNRAFFESLRDVTEAFVLGHGMAEVDRLYYFEILDFVPKSTQWTISYYGNGCARMAQAANEIGIPIESAKFNTLDRI